MVTDRRYLVFWYVHMADVQMKDMQMEDIQMKDAQMKDIQTKDAQMKDMQMTVLFTSAPLRRLQRKTCGEERERRAINT